jgi:hypothetical protein
MKISARSAERHDNAERWWKEVPVHEGGEEGCVEGAEEGCEEEHAACPPFWYGCGCLMAEKPIWERKNPKKKSKTLTASQKAAAKARAAKAGRRYPNMVDNAWAAQRGR